MSALLPRAAWPVLPLRSADAPAVPQHDTCDVYARLGLRSMLPLDVWLRLNGHGREMWAARARKRLDGWRETPPTVAGHKVSIQ